MGTCPLHRGESQPEKPERQCHVHLPEDVGGSGTSQLVGGGAWGEHSMRKT